MGYASRVYHSSYCACWKPDDEFRAHMPLRHSDYRDKVPVPFEEIEEEYARYVTPGQWTVGLCDMWCPKSKVVKHSVHVPCWDSFKVLPWKWRGCVFGRTCKECYWFGLREARWARAAYGGNLGREYMLPVKGVGTHGYKSEIEALCWLTWLLGCVLGCGIGQVFSILGNASVNFAAPYTCHTRSRMRYKYGLPPVFCCLPVGVDDFLVHLLCFYCASHQEMRELVIRGVDGPGLHTMDVQPEAYKHLPGYEEALKKRRRKVQMMLMTPPAQYKINRQDKYPDVLSAVGRSVIMALKESCKHSGRAVTGRTIESMKSRVSKNLGWATESMPPLVQEMSRDIHRTKSDPLPMMTIIQENAPSEDDTKAWSIAY